MDRHPVAIGNAPDDIIDASVDAVRSDRRKAAAGGRARSQGVAGQALALLQPIALVGTMALAPAAEAADRSVNVAFPRGANGTTLSGSIKGYDSITYRVGVTAGQRMSVQLDGNNASSYFNITAPGASEALFNGSVSGNSTSFDVPSSGKYEVMVYLMRNAARRGERAGFKLTLYIENARASGRPQAPGASPRETMAPQDSVDTASMPRFCAGEASAKFGVRPRDITTNMAFRSGNRFVSQGSFDAGGRTTFFNCWFDLDGTFKSVN